MANGLKKKPTNDEKYVAALTEWERLSAFKSDFLADWNADEKFRRGAKEDGEYYDGKMWTDEEKRILEGRGQPPIVINRIKSKVDGLHGIQIANSVDTKAYPAGNREIEAEIISEGLRRIEDQSNFDQQESLATLDNLIEGRFWYAMRRCWDGLKVYTRVKREPIFDWVKDKDSREEDLSDADRIHNTVNAKVSKIKQMFPHKAKELEKYALAEDHISLEDMLKTRRIRPDQYNDLSGQSTDLSDSRSIFCDEKNRKARLVTTYYRTLEVKKFYYHPKLEEPIEVTKSSAKDMQVLMDSFPEGETIQETRKILNSYTFTWNVELEHKQDIRHYDDEARFPAVMGFAYAERGDGTHYGAVRAMKDPNSELNKMRSKTLHSLGTVQIEFTEGAFDNEQKAREEYHRPDGWIKRKTVGNVQVRNHADVSPIYFQMMQQAGQDIGAVGTAPEVEGKSTANSKVELDRRLQIATQPTRKIFDSVKSARRRVAEYNTLDLVRDLNEKGQLESPISKFDIVIEETPDTINQQQETFQTLLQVVPALAQLGTPLPGVGEMLLYFSDIPKPLKDEISAKVQQQQQMQAQTDQAQASALAATAQQGASGNSQRSVQ